MSKANSILTSALLLACDPGRSGSIVYTCSAWDRLFISRKITNSSVELQRFISGAVNRTRQDSLRERVAILERSIGYVPGNSGASAAKFSRSCALVEQALVSNGFTVYALSPQKWMPIFGKVCGSFFDFTEFTAGSDSKSKQQRKHEIKTAVEFVYDVDGIKVTLGNADALALLATLRYMLEHDQAALEKARLK